MVQDVSKLKQRAAEAAVALVEDGMTLGLGTGSTVRFALEALGRRVREGLDTRGIASSSSTEVLARRLEIPLVGFDEIETIDLVIDGADEVSPTFQMIKGGGGALLREKVLAAAAERVVIIVDGSKTVDVLGRFPLPVEVVPYGHELFLRRRQQHGVRAVVRQTADGPLISDNGNLIIDCHLHEISEPEALHQELIAEVGVVETGLFIDLLDHLIIASESGIEERSRQA